MPDPMETFRTWGRRPGGDPEDRVGWAENDRRKCHAWRLAANISPGER